MYLIRRIIRGIFRRIYRAIRTILRTPYYFFQNRWELVSWYIFERKQDMTAFSSIVPLRSLFPIHTREWHHGSQYFQLTAEDEVLFGKKSKRKEVCRREKIFTTILQEEKSCLFKQILRIYGFAEGEKASYMVSEYVTNKRLDQLDLDSLTAEEKETIILQMARTYDALRELDICHNDIRDGNFFFDGKTLRLFDYGYACRFIDREQFVDSLGTDERALNSGNCIGETVLDDAVAILQVMKKVDPELFTSQHDIWAKINGAIGEKSIQKVPNTHEK